MSCPPGKVLNPRTLRCVKFTGRKAQELAQHGNIPEYYAQAPAPVRRTLRRPRVPSFAAAFGAAPDYRPSECPPGHVRNPATRRCIKVGGPTHQRLHQPPSLPPSPRPQPREIIRRTTTERPVTLPVGSAGIAPLADRPTILGWAHAQCRNDRDPITGTPFASADATTLQDMIRLHNRTCTLAGPLNVKVAAEHKAGHVATIPGDQSSHMTLDDFKALRDSMRRHNPAYKLPSRKHQPPPSTWQLYVASDNRSGPEFASVMYIDVNKIVQGPMGPEYPVDSVTLDMGFIPITVTGAFCAPQMVVELIQRVATANRLLTPVAGGWKPIAGFPFSKKYWSGPDVKDRFSKLCRELTRALTTPL